MRQERKNFLKNSEKFEDGVLRADACMERFIAPRDSQYRTSEEDLPCFSFGTSALREERHLMRCVYYLMSLGFKPKGDELLEEFVERHKDLLDEEVF